MADATDKGGKGLRVAVVTPERTVLEVDAKAASVPASDGELGVLPGRAALVCRLADGVLRIATDEGEVKVFVGGGFAQVAKDVVTILTPAAKLKADLSKEAVAEQLAAAQAEAPATAEGMARRRQRIAALVAQQKVLA